MTVSSRNLFRIVLLINYGYLVSSNSTTTATSAPESSVTTGSSGTVSSETATPEVSTAFVNITGNFSQEYTEASDDEKYPFRVCNMAVGTDLYRFDNYITCNKYDTETQYSEGILLLFKKNIVPHTFFVRTYTKELSFQTTYRDVHVIYLVDRSSYKVPVPVDEAGYINLNGQCFSAAEIRNQGINYRVYHKDDNTNNTMRLYRLKFGSTINTRYISTPDFQFTYGTHWLYKSSSSINCIVTDTMGKSDYPYDNFILGTGESVEISPFFNGTSKEVFNEQMYYFSMKSNYTMLEKLDEPNGPKKTIPTIAFLQKGDTLFSWEVTKQTNSHCKYTAWTKKHHALRADMTNSYHFMMKDMTATMVTTKNTINLTGTEYECVKNDIEKYITDTFQSKYNNTHNKTENYSVYETTTGLILVWQPIVRKSIKELKEFINETQQHTRYKREIDGSESLVYASLQYMYDALREYINAGFAQIAEAWCEDQKRTNEVLSELAKINPSNVMSVIYDKSLSAKLVGDAISVSSCVNVNQSTVKVHKDMRIYANGTANRETCFSRPVVTFEFSSNNSVQQFTGQLGPRNEILLGTHRVEKCERNSVKVFFAGKEAYFFYNYIYTKTVNISDINVVDTFIHLNIKPLENTDFEVLRMYSKNELAQANIFDLESLLRDINSYRSALYNIESRIAPRKPDYVSGVDSFLHALGIGAPGGLGAALGMATGAVTDFLTGIFSFFKNPFGGLFSMLFFVLLVFLIFSVYYRQKNIYTNPVGALFPYANSSSGTVISNTHSYYETNNKQESENDRKPDTSNAVSEGSANKYSQEDAVCMLMAIKNLGDAYRRKNTTKPSPSVLDKIRHLEYQQLSTEDV
uniref:Glycoprotein B n=2 Tax=Suid betaherpesvirus 2 TaxID=1608255 RepID=A0A0H5B8S1_9BETA|nr:glycoprotein B [Suid betaherpesvirus 2]